MTIFNIKAVKPGTSEVLNLKYDNELNRLETEAGFVFSSESSDGSADGFDSIPFGKDSPLRKSRHVRMIKIQLGLSCNYTCDYCSQRFVERAPETSKKHIDEFIQKLSNLSFSESSGLKIELWGGEPLVYWKTIKPLVEALQLKFAGWKKKPRFSMITNGSLLTPEICYWLLVNDFSVGISHDGPGQHVRGPDPFDDPEKKKIILDFYRAMKAQGRISFNAMLNASNTSRMAIHEWFVNLTGDKAVTHGEGALVDAYDDGGMANLLDTKAKHFAFRKQAFNEIYSSGGDIGFDGIVAKIDQFTTDVLGHKPATKVGQKCGMDREDVISIDLHGNVLTCQNVSAAATSFNGESHNGGNIEDLSSVAIKTATHWRNRSACSSCPVLHICKGSCMFIDGENWSATCSNAYSDAVALFALSIEKITQGFVPVMIDGEGLPDDRRDIWGDILNHVETPKRKSFPIKVVAEKSVLDGIDVYSRSEIKEIQQ
jgi:uncharacterized protein